MSKVRSRRLAAALSLKQAVGHTRPSGNAVFAMELTREGERDERTRSGGHGIVRIYHSCH